ncbi:hypothetical protein FQV28_08790 [Planomicrobium sp. CPCC 101079]|nr:hypothetical protein [Planomicrobium sp. CPCC 101079]TWT04688.1 hypothetical protein FQV28_08790 [Planomicrobium sp. CPCC 101079]
MEYVWIIPIAGIVLGAVYGFYLSVNGRMKMLELRIENLNERILQITKGEGGREPEVNNLLRELMEQGETVKAVKEARKALGLSLLEAKQYVDAL